MQVAVQITAIQQRAAFSGTGPAAWALGANCMYKASSTAALQNVTVVNITSSTKWLVQPAKATPTSKQPANITVSLPSQGMRYHLHLCMAAPCGIHCRPCCIAAHCRRAMYSQGLLLAASELRLSIWRLAISPQLMISRDMCDVDNLCMTTECSLRCL